MPTRTSGEAAWTAPAFVWGTWAAVLLGSLAFIASFSSVGVPYQDEIIVLAGWGHGGPSDGGDPRATGLKVTPGWFWDQHSEHRIPLAKLIWFGVLKLTNYNFRVGNFLTVLGLGALAAGLILAARSVRGRTSYADAFFPLAVLNFSQAQNYLWWWQFNHVLPALLASALLILIVVRGNRLGFRGALAAAVCLILLSLSGPGALPFVLALGLWLAAWGVASWRAAPGPRERRLALLVLGLVGAAVLLVPIYFVGLRLQSGMEQGHSSSPPAISKATLQIATLSLGTVVRPYWELAAVGVIGLALASLAVLAVEWYRRPEERMRVLGLFLFLGASAALLATIGMARAGMGEDYIYIGHYLPKAIPALCCVYLVFVAYRGRTLGALVQMGLFTVTCVLLIPNLMTGIWTGRFLLFQSDLERDVRAGVPPFVLAERYPHLVQSDDPSLLTATYRRLKRDGIGVFREMQPDPEFREVAIPLRPVEHHEAASAGGAGYARETDPPLVFALGQPTRVYAIRVKLSYKGAKSPSSSLQVFWKQAGQPEFAAGTGRDFTAALPAVPGDRTVTVWVNDTIDGFRIDPHEPPYGFTISEVRLLVPVTE